MDAFDIVRRTAPFNFVWSLLIFNIAQYLFAFYWLVILWLPILITTVLFYQISKMAVISCCHISYGKPLRNIWILHLSAALTSGSLREHNRQSTGMTLAQLCDYGVNPPMLIWVCWKLYQGAGKGGKAPLYEWCFLLSFLVSYRKTACFWMALLILRRIEH